MTNLTPIQGRVKNKVKNLIFYFLKSYRSVFDPILLPSILVFYNLFVFHLFREIEKEAWQLPNFFLFIRKYRL